MSNPSDFIVEDGVLKRYSGTGGKVIIPDSVTSIGESAFSYCSLISVTIPEGVTSIGKKAFYFCTDLTTLTLPSSLESVEEQAFYCCNAIKEVHIQDLAAWCRIRFSGSYSNPLDIRISFSNHPALLLNGASVTEAVFSEGSLGSVIANLGNVKSLKKVLLPAGIKEIDSNAFSECVNLESIMIPEGVFRIGSNAFSRCMGLTSLTLPESLREIGQGAFSHCRSMTSVSIPDRVVILGDRAFDGCSDLTKAVLPEKLEKIGSFVFADCPKLRECIVPVSINKWGKIPAAYEDGAYYTDSEGRKEILEVFAPGQEVYCVPTWASLLRENSLIGTKLKQIKVSAGTMIDENVFGKDLFGKNLLSKNPDIFTGSFMEVHKELPSYYLQFFEKTEKTPELLACRMLYQSGKLWNEALTDAAEKADKAAIIRVMLHLLEEEGGEKPAAKIAGMVLDYLEELDIEEMKGAYTALRKGNYKALRNLVLDEGFQNKWLQLTGKEDSAETGAKNPIEELVEKNWRTTEAVKKLRKAVKDGIRYRDTDRICPPNVLIFLVSEYADQLDEPERLPIRLYDTYYPQGIHISETADQIAAALDTEQLREKLEFLAYLDKSFRNGFVLALARYGSGRQISHLSSEMRERANWGRHGVAGRQDVMIARGALMLSETREAMIALDKDGSLENYAKMRGTDAETIRDTVLADFGFDQAGKKTYDLGGNRVSVSVDSDLTLRLYDEGAKKTVKSIPKKNADPALLEAAKADVSDLKKNIKRVITHRRDVVFDDFLSGVERDSAKWKKIYLSNPVLRALARLIVWEQAGRRFTVDETGTVDCSDAPFTVADDVPIRVAHPLELPSEEIKAWQDYFMRHALKQPFEQIWEPVYDPAEIGADRYQGAELPIYRFANKDRHGIHSYGLTAYSEDYGFELDDCDLDYEGSTSRIIPGETDDETYTLGAFRLEKLTRRSNHIIFVLDKWTILDRIENNDGSIAALLPAFTLAQLTEFIRLANEKGSSNSLAVLMDYKNRNFAEADPFAEFTLD